MARQGEEIENPVTGMRVRFVQTAAETGGDLLEMEASYRPGSNEPPPHHHPSQREHFEVLEGAMTVRIGDEPPRELRAGETLDVEPQIVHSMWNAGPGQARLRWETRPALRTAEFFEETTRVFSDAVAEDREPDGARMAAIIETYSDEFRLGAPS